MQPVTRPKDHTIMIVDDDEKVLDSLKRTFTRLGYNVLVAKSGEEGLDILRSENVGLIISDIRMPTMSGIRFLEKTKEVAPDAVRIAITAYADIQAAADAINNVDVSKFILKPWDRYHLEKVVRQGLKHYDTVRENKRLYMLSLEQNEELAKKAAAADKTAASMKKKIAELENKLDKLSTKYPDTRAKERK